MKMMHWLTIILLSMCAIAIFFLLPHPETYIREVGASWVRIAGQMGIQNMVTAVYLGPRVFDTFIEVMVVVLTVYGIKYVREKA